MERIIFLCLLYVFQAAGVSVAENCTSHTYLDFDNQWPSKEFNAGSKVILKLFCENLPPGQHVARVNWIKNNYGTVRTDSSTFTLNNHTNRDLYFWFKLSKPGLINRFTSLSDYNPEMIGSWSTESYLNGKLVGRNQFNMH